MRRAPKSGVEGQAGPNSPPQPSTDLCPPGVYRIRARGDHQNQKQCCALYVGWDRLHGVLQILGGDDPVLVHVDDTKSFLELLDPFLTEQGEDVGARLFGLL